VLSTFKIKLQTKKIMETVNLKSGEFLVKEVDANDIFIPE